MLRKATERISLHKILTKVTHWLVKTPLYCNRATSETNRYLLLLKSFFSPHNAGMCVCKSMSEGRADTLKVLEIIRGTLLSWQQL